jgi:hypothetical protein
MILIRNLFYVNGQHFILFRKTGVAIHPRQHFSGWGISKLDSRVEEGENN